MATFITELNAAARWWADAIWLVSWQSTVLAAVVAAVTGLALRRSSPALRFWVWQVLALKLLLMPFWILAIPSPWRPTADVPAEVVSESATLGALDGETTAAVEETPPAELSPDFDPPRGPALPAITWQGWIFLGWAPIVVAQGARLCRQRLRLRRWLAQAEPAEEALRREVAEIAKTLGLRQAPRTIITPAGNSPFVYGVRRPTLAVSRELLAVLSDAERRHVLLHELAHIRRHDLAWGWVGEVVRILYFFDPVAHWLAYRLRLERELACDQWALALSGREPAEYAATLVRVVTCALKPSCLQAVTASTAGPPQLSTFWKRRLAMLPSLSHIAHRPSRRALMMVVLLGVAVFSLPAVRFVSLRAAPPAGQEVERAAAEKTRAAALRGVLVPARGDDRKAAEDPDTEQRMLDAYLPSPSETEQKILRTLDKPTTVVFVETPLEDALNFLKDFHNINIWIDRVTLSDDGVALDAPVTLNLAGVRLESVLNLLLRPSQLDFVIEDDVMKVTTRTRAYDTEFVRTYPVHDLYPNGKAKKTQGTDGGKKEETEKGEETKAPAAPETIGDLERAIRETIEPKSWAGGSIAYVSESGSLVIRQSWPVHRKVLKLLRDLRQAKRISGTH